MIVETVAYCVASSVGTAAIYAAIQFRSNIRTAITNLFIDDSTKKLLQLAYKHQQKLDNEDDELGLSYEEYEMKNPESEEEYLERLKYIHGKAWDDYKRYGAERVLMEDADMIMYKTLLSYHAGGTTLDMDSHHAYFSSGLTIWIENKYYSWGNIANTYVKSDSFSKKMKAFTKYVFSGTSGKYSPYTFMWLVDTVFKEQNPLKWKEMHDQYTRDKISKGK